MMGRPHAGFAHRKTSATSTLLMTTRVPWPTLTRGTCLAWSRFAGEAPTWPRGAHWCGCRRQTVPSARPGAAGRPTASPASWPPTGRSCPPLGGWPRGRSRAAASGAPRHPGESPQPRHPGRARKHAARQGVPGQRRWAWPAVPGDSDLAAGWRRLPLSTAGSGCRSEAVPGEASSGPALSPRGCCAPPRSSAPARGPARGRTAGRRIRTTRPASAPGQASWLRAWRPCNRYDLAQARKSAPRRPRLRYGRPRPRGQAPSASIRNPCSHYFRGDTGCCLCLA